MIRRLLLSALVTAALLAGVAIQPTASAANNSDGHPATTLTRTAVAMGKERLVHSRKRSGPRNGDCAKAAERARRATGVARFYDCLTWLTPAQGKAALRATTASVGAAALIPLDAPLPVNDCTGDEDGYWYATRTMQCQIYPNVQYTYRDSNGAILGTALFATAQQLDLSTTSLQWTETDQVTMLSKTGTLPVGLSVSWTTTCSSPCTSHTIKPWTTAPISNGQNLKKTYTLVDQPSTGYDYIDLSYKLSIGAPDAIDLLPPITWGGAEVRCDNKISVVNNAGCIVPWYTPTLRVPRSQYGASADMIEWAQHNLSGHWGLRGTGQPLHRLQGDSQRKANRSVICGSSRFTVDPNVQDDSCDEFPFAGNYESGALNGVTHGKDCAQVTAVRADTSGNIAVDWPTITTVENFTGNEKCVRGHIPGALNSDVGGAYGRFVTDMRLADNDPFWLNITF